jgi:iron(III) transport system substrate-binding protein
MTNLIRPSTPPILSRRLLMQAAAAGVVVLGAPRAFAQANKLLWYTGASVESAEDWTKIYKDKANTTVDYYRAGGVKLAQKFEQEAKAGQVACDVVDATLPGLMTQWAKQGLLMKYDSPEAKHYPADLRLDGYWTPIKALDTCMVYNTDIIKEADAPKNWEDLLDPKWKGKMVMADPFFSGGTLHWYAAMRKTFGKAFVEKLAKQNILLRNGNGEVLDTVVSGERPLAASALQYYASAKAADGVKVRMVFPIEGVPSGIMVIGVTAKAPNPEGAKKFVDFALGKEAQEIWQTKHFTPSLRDDVAPLPDEYGRTPFNKVKLLASSTADMMELHENQGAILDEFGALYK